MTKKMLLFWLLCSTALFAQNLPDSISVYAETTVTPFTGPDKVTWQGSLMIKKSKGAYYINESNTSVSEKKIAKLVQAVNNPMTFDEHFKTIDIDTLTIRNKTKKLLNTEFEWTPAQLEYILPILSDIENYKTLYEEDFYTGYDFALWIDAPRDKTQLTVVLYEGGKARTIVTNKSRSGYALPWVSSTGEENFNPSLKRALADVLGGTFSDPQIKDRTRYFADKIITANGIRLYELAAQTYAADIEKLKEQFTVEKAILDYYDKSRYAFKLHTDDMLPNMHINFYASEKKGKLYTSDSLKADYKEMVTRIQGIDFIVGFVKENPQTQLYINYYNNSAITPQLIEQVNTHPKLWAKHDKYVKEQQERVARYPSGEQYLEDNIKYSKERNCGCNLRLNDEVIKKAITFEVIMRGGLAGGKSYSTWLLLPDGRVLLYSMEGETLLNFKYDQWGNKTPGVQTPCKVFDFEGNVLN
jgi:hypothetical protein